MTKVSFLGELSL